MKNILEQFKGLKVLVVGDVMIDTYYFGKVERISPEAPVPVVAVEKKENRLV
jgi:bifunctional ADP-heptose synthase (sugar kinase/adenylyltransferase)